MAEFKISRIRYTWRSDWVNGRAYIKDDVVKFGGSSWVCIRQHTSGQFASDQTFLANPSDTDPSPAWKKMTDGFSLRSPWSPNTLYSPGDIIPYGGVLYLCVTSYTSSSIFDDNIANLTIYVSSTVYRQDWIPATRYGIGDAVRYGGTVYRCIEGHTSNDVENGLEIDEDKWSIYYEGEDYVGTWVTGTRYKPNELVKYGGTVFRCVIGHTSTEESFVNYFTNGLWQVEFSGFEFAGEWNAETAYQVGDVVRHGGNLYYSTINNLASDPIDSIYQPTAAVWQLLIKATNFRGEWQSSNTYKTGDLVRRGGNVYIALLDTTDDGSSLDYLDTSNWELATTGQNWENFWRVGQHYSINDVVIYLGSAYACNTEHESSLENFPGDNGSGFEYWDTVIEAASPTGLKQRGDLLTFGLSRDEIGDGSTFDVTNVEISDVPGQLLTINSNDDIFYKTYGEINRVFYVATNGIDSLIDPQQGKSPFKPWKTVRYACERADDSYSGTTTIRVAAGKYHEILPIIVPARTVVLGTELRTTTIAAAPAISALALDDVYTRSTLSRISQLMQSIIAGTTLSPAKSPNNPSDPVVIIDEETEDPLTTSPQAAIDIQLLIVDIQRYINYHINSVGTNPTVTGTNTATAVEGYLTAIEVLEANREFLKNEAVAYMELNFPNYDFDSDLCKRDIDRYINAWKYDLLYTGNYKSLLAARYYRNAVLGSEGEDMFYCRDATGVRNCTLNGLEGTLAPITPLSRYRIPTGGAFVSLDPGWGPNDDRTWIRTRSPYIQGVTTFGTGAIGQKIDGALHNGGNRSIVSNDFTQVISDGIGAWVANNGRAELVSVFSYYAHVGYLATEGGIIRGTNGNCSYGDFGALADGVDATEVPTQATVFNRNQEAIVAAAFAGDFVDEIQILEWRTAGQNYTQATASFVGAGVSVSTVFDDFRDDAVFECRLLDTSNTVQQLVGGGGYGLSQNNAQSGGLTSIIIASNDPNSEEEYLGKRVVITSGVGTGQYGYITALDEMTKEVSVARESDDQPGWDHVVPGKRIEPVLGTSTTYRIEPRVIFSEPEYSATEISVGVTTPWSAITYGETTETFSNIEGIAGTGSVFEAVPSVARFNIVKLGRIYSVTIADAGAGYAIDDEIVILGSELNGVDNVNDLTIRVTAVTDDSTNSIVSFVSSGTGTSGKFVALTSGGSAGVYSSNAEEWESFNMPTAGDWVSMAAGNNRFVAIRKGSNLAASSLDGVTWTSRTMPFNRQWNSVAYGGGVFLAVAGNLNSSAFSVNGTTWSNAGIPAYGDSTFNEWVDVAYGKGKFVVLANSGNSVAEGTYNSESNSWNWEYYIMDIIDDSTQKDWVSVAYGNNRWVAMSATGEVAYSFTGIEWFPASMPTQDGSTIHNWKKIRYAQGVFFAVGDTGGRNVGGDTTSGPTTFAATSFDGIVWSNKELATSANWVDVAFGNPYVDSLDSTTGKNTPMWVTLATTTDKINKVRTGARALGRVSIVAGKISEIRLWDTGSGYQNPPTVTLVDPTNTSDVSVETRIADGVLTNPSWISRGLGYRTNTTSVSISGDGFADIIPAGKFITINALPAYPGPGAQIIFDGNTTRYTIVTVESVTENVGGDGFSARLRVSPEIKVRDKLEHGTGATIRQQYSQVRITGHDFLDIGTGNFEETNYPELYSRLYQSAPEDEVVQENGGRVFYTSTDQSGNFRTGELFAVEQATGIVTISADFFDFSGLTELRLGGIRVGGTGAVIREFSTDALFTEDSNNIVPTQRAIAAHLAGRLSIGGSEIAVGSFIAGTIRVGPNLIASTAGIKIIVPVRADFNSAQSGIKGSIMAQSMFYKSFSDQ